MPTARPVQLALSLSLSLLVASPLVAEAGKDGGGRGGGGGGRLGQVSAGMGRASSSGSSAPSVGRGGPYTTDYRDPYCEEPVEPLIISGGVPVRRQARPQRPTSVKVDFFAGAQKVHESDGALSVELALNEGRFRFGGSITRYYERQDGAEALTLTVPAVYIGARIDDGGPTRAYLEVGAVGARTRHDPVMDSSFGGVLGGVRIDHRISRRLTAVGDAQIMAFDHDVRAAAMRAGIRYGHLQATVRYFDLNVGPALFGPEVGFRF